MVAHFIFYKHTKPNKKNAKELPCQRTKTAVNNGQQSNDRQERQQLTRVWQKWRFSAPQTYLWLIKIWFSASTFVLKIPHLRQPPKPLPVNFTPPLQTIFNFFEKNQWIFGYGLDYRYQEILQREVHFSDAELDGSNTVIGDYLLGDNFFTTFVELKKPTTPLFANKGNRSNSWKLSNDLIESVSQILEHKASGLIRLDSPQYIKGERLKQKAYDSKVILIIGDWKELEKSANTLEKDIKKKTLELFRRDSRHVEILTFDELYERAKFIVEGAKNKTAIVPNSEFNEDDDLPF